ncbi:MAG: NAD-dependent epimerase/dehydratase family protein [Chitinophagales bacterium]|nr:NAD-dependent epimerase/dehydratase family protein [Chitinophagales bacterium]
MGQQNILVIGAGGQIGTVLVEKLIQVFGITTVFATDLKENAEKGISALDVMDKSSLESFIEKNKIQEIYHLAAILSARGEQNPQWAWDINMGGLFNVLETAVKYKVEKVFYPSTIAVFGKHIPLENTPNHVPLVPATVYGISKVAGELWAEYYFNKYGLDVRSVRYPGVIGYQSLAGGGTTDYAVDIFHAEAKNEVFQCFLSEHTKLPMIYMEDCINATIDIMRAPIENIKIRTSYNLAGMSFSPLEIATEIQKRNPNFRIEYNPDFRQAIAATWPQSIDDSNARKDWGWKPKYDLSSMVDIMMTEVRKLYPSLSRDSS